MRSGVYAIVDTTDGRTYIGSSVDIPRRFRQHKRMLNLGKHANAHLNRAWAAHSPEAFYFKILLFCAPDQVLTYEQRAIEAFDAVVRGFNQLPVAGSTAGRKHTEAARAKMSEAHIGRITTERARENMRRGQANRPPPSEETRARRRAAMLGRTFSEETLRKMSEAHKGRILTPEQKARQIAAQTGKKRTSETRQKIAEKHPVGRSGERGISWNSRAKSYHVRVRAGSKVKSLGYYKTMEEAKNVRDANPPEYR